ncbi:MAG: hypothetical protein AAF871_16395 [Pseudomonadota bacterium]
MPLDQSFTLTFPEDVADRVRYEYNRARTVLEYGSGGSTLVGAGIRGLKLFSVELDLEWARSITKEVAAVTATGASVHVHHADIGPTEKWGHPVRRRLAHGLRYWRYARSVWRRPDFEHPDLVLIDGRFRIACFLAVLTRIKRPTRVLFDDYEERAVYHWVERFAKPVEFCGRMAVFELAPARVPLRDLPGAFRRAFWPR